MSGIYTRYNVHGGSKIIIEIDHHDSDKPWDMAKIFVIKEKTEKNQEEKMEIIEIYGDENKKMKVEVLCKKLI